jgi:hypothetical protein
MRQAKGITKIPEEPLELQDALAAIIANTKRVNRKLNLIEIAHKIRIARKYLPLDEIADRTMLSKEMLREFERVNKLGASVRALILDGKLKSVEIADRLSRLPILDQVHVAKEIVRGDISSEDLRGIVSLKRNIPSLNIFSAIQRIKKSRNIREYVVEFVVPKDLYSRPNLVRMQLEKIFGQEHLRSFYYQRGVATVSLDSKAKKALVQDARELGITKREYLGLVVSKKGGKKGK